MTPDELREYNTCNLLQKLSENVEKTDDMTFDSETGSLSWFISWREAKELVK